MTVPRSIYGAVALSGLLFLAGCSGGSSEGRVEVYPVTGKITLNGAPVANAIVSFSPTGEQPAATGRTDGKGVYSLTTYDAGDGAAAGEYEVLVVKESVSPAASAAPGGHDPNARVSTPSVQHSARGGRAAAGSGSALPDKYSRRGQSGLEAKVTANGKNTFDYDLKL
jgi:hypothetical protein